MFPQRFPFRKQGLLSKFGDFSRIGDFDITGIFQSGAFNLTLFKPGETVGIFILGFGDREFLKIWEFIYQGMEIFSLWGYSGDFFVKIRPRSHLVSLNLNLTMSYFKLVLSTGRIIVKFDPILLSQDYFSVSFFESYCYRP